MTKILFICSGNVGRSQMAEAFYNHYTKTKDASSAGTDPLTPSKYVNPSKEVCKIMQEEGIDISKNKVKFVTEEMVKEANKIFILCKKELCPDFLLNSNKISYLEIEDPYKMDLEGTRKIKNIIKDKVKLMVYH